MVLFIALCFIPMLIMVIVLSWFIKLKDKHNQDASDHQDSLRTLMETGQITPMEYNELKLKTLPFKR